MIPISELRIGNWAMPCDEDIMFPVQIKSISPKDEDYYNPIPLTPDLLDGFGFECSNRVSMSFKMNMDGKGVKHIQVKLAEVGNDPEWVVGYSSGCVFVSLHKIKYLHHLQNFFFALTGKEIDVQIPSFVL